MEVLTMLLKLLPFKTQKLDPRQKIQNLFIQTNQAEALSKADLTRTAALFHFYMLLATITVLQSFWVLKLLFPLTFTLQKIVFSVFLANPKPLHSHKASSSQKGAVQLSDLILPSQLKFTQNIKGRFCCTLGNLIMHDSVEEIPSSDKYQPDCHFSRWRVWRT